MHPRCAIFIFKDTLNLSDLCAAWASAVVSNHKLSPEKRKYLTFRTLLANEPDKIVELVDVALKRLTHGMPLPIFNNPKDDAK